MTDDGGVTVCSSTMAVLAIPTSMGPVQRVVGGIGREFRERRRRLDVVVHRNLTLANVADAIGEMHGTRCIASIPEPLTAEQLAATVARWSDAIAAHTEAGDRVVVATPNGYQQLMISLAVARAGALPVPVNDQMHATEIEHVTRDAGASFVIRSADDLAGTFPMCPAAEPDPDDVAALFYTSGTTGRPKGAELTHAALVGQLAVAALWPPVLARGEIIAALPVAHIMGFVTYLAMAVAGQPVLTLPTFRATEVLALIEERQAIGFIGVPAMYRKLIDAGAATRDLSSVKLWMSGADVMPADLIHRFKEFGSTIRLPGIGPVGEAAFVEGYGMVETAGGVAAKVSPPLVGLGSGSSVGIPLPGVRMRVVDEDGEQVPVGQVGELMVKAPGVLRGYWNSPEATDDALTPDGWLRTGDLVRSGPFGMLAFQGRRKQVIKSGGYSVYPAEIESVMEEHPDVVEAAAFGLDHAALGQVPAVAVRLRPGSSVTPEKLVNWSGDRLAHYKAPRKVVIVADFPRTGTGKVQKDALAAEHAAENVS